MKYLKSRSRKWNNEISAGSLADIAFLLLIFFLVSTTIEQDQGILVRLPPYENDINVPKIADRNIYRILLNKEGQILLRNQTADLEMVSDRVVQFIGNYGLEDHLSTSPQKAVVSLLCDRGSTYKDYIAIYNEILKAYNELRDVKAAELFGHYYKACTLAEQRKIRAEIPLLVSESEPADFGQ